MHTENENSKMQGTSLAKLKSEHQVSNEILLTYGALPWLRIWRMNTGKAYGYSVVKNALALMYNGLFEQAFTKFKTMPLTTYGTPGASDIQGILRGTIGDGRFIAIEVKGSKGVQSDEQIAWQKMIESSGGIYILARSVEDVAGYFRDMGYKF